MTNTTTNTTTAYTSSLITRFNDDAPALWVGCLAAYNAGTLHGAWLNVTSDEAEVMEAVQEILAASPVVGAEEWEVMDAQLLPGAAGRTVAAACAYVALLDEIEDTVGGDAAEILAAWVDWRGELPESADQLVDAYLGQFNSVQEYAEQYADDCGLLDGLPENLRGYFNFAAFARDLELGGDVHHGQHGHTFNGHA